MISLLSHPHSKRSFLIQNVAFHFNLVSLTADSEQWNRKTNIPRRTSRYKQIPFPDHIFAVITEVFMIVMIVNFSVVQPRRGSLVSSFLFPIGTFTKPEVNNQPRRLQADNGNVERNYDRSIYYSVG